MWPSPQTDAIAVNALCFSFPAIAACWVLSIALCRGHQLDVNQHVDCSNLRVFYGVGTAHTQAVGAGYGDSRCQSYFVDAYDVGRRNREAATGALR